MSSNTHECEKLVNVSEQSQKIGEFLDWLLNEKGYVLAKWNESRYTDRLLDQHVSINSLLADYFKIDLNKVELERRALLRDLHVAHRERNRGK